MLRNTARFLPALPSTHLHNMPLPYPKPPQEGNCHSPSVPNKSWGGHVILSLITYTKVTGPVCNHRITQVGMDPQRLSPTPGSMQDHPKFNCYTTGTWTPPSKNWLCLNPLLLRSALPSHSKNLPFHRYSSILPTHPSPVRVPHVLQMRDIPIIIQSPTDVPNPLGFDFF